MQYEKRKLSYYKDIKEIKTKTIYEQATNHRQTTVMTKKCIAILSSSGNIYLSYINSTFLSKNIILYPNSWLEFQINEFIKNGIDQLQFSFVEIYQYLTIYKNSIEVKIGEAFHDLYNFTYYFFNKN